MSNAKRYIPGPSEPPGVPILIPGNQWDRKGISPLAVIVIALVIIAVIVGLTIYLINNIQRETVEQTSSPDLYNLNELINLGAEGTCCVPTGGTITSKQWVYSPSADFTFSINKTQPAIVCQGLTGVDLNNCLNYVADSNGDPIPLAHYGTTLYYAFSPGESLGICDYFDTCED